MNCGVYKIENLKTGKVYIGSSKNISSRIKSHLWLLNNGRHHSSKLSRAWAKYGQSAFNIATIIICEIKDLLMYEQAAIDLYDSYSSGYNETQKAGSREGAAHNAETLKSMRDFQRSERKKYLWKGRMLCLAEIAEQEGIDRDLLIRRALVDGWDIERSVMAKKQDKNKPYGLNGEEKGIKEWAVKIGCTEQFLRLWLNKGLSIYDCIGKHKNITIHEFGRLFGVDGKLFHSRIMRGASIPDALSEPARKNKLTKEVADEIRSKKTTTRKQLANEYGVSVDTINLVVNNKIWV